jgi:predicted PurR-regulated permease PerM
VLVLVVLVVLVVLLVRWLRSLRGGRRAVRRRARHRARLLRHIPPAASQQGVDNTVRSGRITREGLQ